MKLRIALLALIICSNVSAERPTQKEQALQPVKDYALSTACDTTFEKSKYNNFGDPNPENYTVTFTDTSRVYQGINNYYVLWGGYEACSIGASGKNYSYYLTEVAYNEYANRYIIQEHNVLNHVADEPFFNLGNLQSLEQVDYNTFKINIYMFRESDLEPLTGDIRESAKPIYYTLTIVPDYSTIYGYVYKVIDKSGIKLKY
ncbi:hypothetical protein [Acinetobacter sp. YH12043]|uniref:hypothetical protein n=1 Tax=Acinetobacter sp. YH12043 TaxID=2601050 RepID=UPI0015D35D53|nr:hypothetical protein [Acinetobacter sp. YH12043]